MPATQNAASIAAEIALRDTSTVLNHHLGAFAQGLEELLVDYNEQSVLITPDQTLHGLRQISKFFEDFLNNATSEFWQAFALKAHKVEDEIAYITWQAPPFVTLATDTLLIRNGQIVIQTFTPFAP